MSKIWRMFEKRVQLLKKQIRQEGLDAVFISSHAGVTYLSGYSNFSKNEREAYIFVGKKFAYIITDGRYSEAIKKEVPHLNLYERGNRKSAEKLFKIHKKEIKSLGIEEDNLTVEEHKNLKKHFKNLKHFSFSRSIKTKEEIEKIEKACQLGDKAFHHVLGYIKHGITEKEFAFEIELFIKKNKAELSFPIIVAFGKNSSVPHHQTSDKRLTINDKFILIDMGVKLDNYCSDMTRTIFFDKITQKHRKIYQTVLEAQKKAVDFINAAIKSGLQIKAADVDKIAREYIQSKGYPSILHSLGHGIGLEVHENPHISPKSKDILKKGMVFSIEPGIYLPARPAGGPAGKQGIPGFGGVRIEDLFVLEKGGLRQITKSLKELIVIQ